MRTLIEDIMAGAKAVKAQTTGPSQGDVDFSKLSGIDPRDVHTLRMFTLFTRLLMVIRCPPTAALAWHGILQPKTFGASKEGVKTGADGVAIDSKGRRYVSDYDLMCIRRLWNNHASTRVVATGIDPETPSRLSDEATLLLGTVNSMMVSRFQHGCQDDWNNLCNRGVKAQDRFAVFNWGAIRYIPNRNEMKRFYFKNRIRWPYDENGNYKYL
jgi:hypothetical protein